MSAIVENAVGGLIASEVHGVIGMVLSRVKAEINLAWGFKKELKELESQLTRLSGLLQGASRSGESTNLLMNLWLEKIKDAAYDAEDLLDKWSYKAIEDSIHTRNMDKLRQSVCKPIRHWRMGHEAENLKRLINEIDRFAKENGIRPIDVAAGEVYNTHHQIEDREKRLRNQRYFVDEKQFIGRDEDLTRLVQLICDPNNNSSDLTVITVVGMAGLGKTTLCKRISKEQEVTKFFDEVIWVVVSRSFNLQDVLRSMVQMLFTESSSITDTEDLMISKLSIKLKKRKYLLILDDLWDTIQWEPLKSNLENIGGSFGTTILVTSRDNNTIGKLVTYSCDCKGNCTLKRPYIHTLKTLSEDESWSLFMARVNDDNIVGNEKEVMARRMMKNCGGVPLAIRALGDLLRDKTTMQWMKIEESPLWTKGDGYGTLPSLRLSYDYLPHTLKICFAYCAIFREDEVIDKKTLICLWMAQGFLHPDEVLEGKGEEYIEYLLNVSLFQEPKMNMYGEEVSTFKMHDLVWSLARDVSKREFMCLNKDEKPDKVFRHLLVPVHSNIKEVSLTSFTKLRTCLIYKKFEHPSLDYMLECRRLRVLNIGLNWSKDLDWEPLGSLIHLRYFEISVGDTSDFMHSKHITKLYHLQTLCIECRYLVKKDRNCYFPKEIGKLVNLRHILDGFPIGIPMGLFHLTALQSLPPIKLEWKWGGSVSDLRSLTNLRGALEIFDLCVLSGEQEARGLALNNKSHLECLKLHWGYNRALNNNPHANEIAEALQPNASLKILDFDGYNGTRFPRWMMGEEGSSLSNLVRLVILCCSKADGNLKLENFGSLRFLEVYHCGKLSITFPKEGFRGCKSLENIKITECNKVENPAVLFSLPCLRTLDIDDLELVSHLDEDSPVCKSLTELGLFGSTEIDDGIDVLPDQLQHLQSLQLLRIWFFQSLETIPDWLGKLKSLNTLELYRLPRLKNLPSQHVMQQFNTLRVLDCPLLEEKGFKNKNKAVS